ncbi:MAG: BACON domain-containing protein [Bacteroidales bacterium]
MKTKLILLLTQSLFFIVLFSACDKDTVYSTPTPAIQLNKKAISAHPGGAEEAVQLTATGDWEIKEVPAWITLSKMAGKEADNIVINISENRAREGRMFTLTFFCGNTRDTLNVHQLGLKDLTLSPALPFFQFSRIDVSETKYSLQSTALFVNPDIRSRIYMGNLICPNAQSNTNISEYTGYTFNPITVVTALTKSRDIYPSKVEQDAYAEEVIAQHSSQIESFGSDNGSTEFYSYKQLYAIGLANLGVKLDEVVTGSSFIRKEMTRNFGLIFSFQKVAFTIFMDYPVKLITENLKEEDRTKGVAYINSVSYGKVGLLVVESDIDARIVKTAINKKMSNLSLSAEENKAIAQADITYVYFDNSNQVKKQQGNPLDVINAYKTGIVSNSENIYPVKFTLANYDNHGVMPLSFSFNIPQ